jgi:LuxR family transcriptional regulator
MEQARRENQLGRLASSPDLINEVRRHAPFDQFAISGLDYPGLGAGSGVILASDMPEEFLKAWIARGLFSIDPLAQGVSPEHPIASWHDLTPQERETPAARSCHLLCTLHGLSQRTVFAFYNDQALIGGATFTRDTSFSEIELFALEQAARRQHQILSETRFQEMNQHLGLSAGEISCLQAIGDGLTTQETAEKEGYTLDTVNFYIKSAIKKLGSTNRTHAVAECIRRRLFR